MGLETQFDRWRFLQRLLDLEMQQEVERVNRLLYCALELYYYRQVKEQEARRLSSSSGNDADVDAGEEQSASSGSPELTAALRERIEELLFLRREQPLQHRDEEEEVSQQEEEAREEEGRRHSTIEALRLAVAVPSAADGGTGTTGDNDDDFVPNLDVLDRLEALLPDPIEDEDAHKGLWDTVIELHGREATKLDEQRRIRRSQQHQSPAAVASEGDNDDDDDDGQRWRACCLIARVLIHFDFLSRGL